MEGSTSYHFPLGFVILSVPLEIMTIECESERIRQMREKRKKKTERKDERKGRSIRDDNFSCQGSCDDHTRLLLTLKSQRFESSLLTFKPDLLLTTSSQQSLAEEK